MIIHVFDMLQNLPPQAIVMLRRPRTGPPAWFEANIEDLCKTLRLEVDWFEPEPGGRGQVFQRDFMMVEAATQVHAYFAPDTPMEGGTGHVVEAAMMREVPVYAWSVQEEGVVRLGELER